jgi:hypothetical protein
LVVNNVTTCIERDGRYFIDKLKPGTRKDYVTVEIPRRELAIIRSRLERGEPLQDFEGLISLAKNRWIRGHASKGSTQRKRG